MKNPSSILLKGAYVALGALLIVALAGCNDSGTKVTLPLATLTPITNCIVDAQDDVEIGNADDAPEGCTNVVLSPDSATHTFGEIEISDGGTLTITGKSAAPHTGTAPFPPIARLEEICIGTGGTLLIGREDNPITEKNPVELTFVGDRNFAPIDPLCTGDFKKGIQVNPGGTLMMYGTKGVPSRKDADGNGGISWTTLAEPAGPMTAGAAESSTGPTTLHLTANVAQGAEGWNENDWIVVATTDYDPFHSEFVQIKKVDINTAPDCADTTQGCSTVTLKQPLKYYHFGSLPPSPETVDNAKCADPFAGTAHPVNKDGQPQFLCDGADRNYGVDERAEIGLISRDITLTADTEPVTSVPPSATSSVHWGGEIMIHQGFKQVVIQGARLEKFGKDHLGSYPIHFHLVGDASATKAPLIDADSVDHSYNKCVTIHATSNLTISNLVCARIVGHIFYEELQSAGEDNPAGDSGLVFKHNLGIGAMSNSFDIYGTDKAGQSRKDLINQYWWAGDYMTNNPASPTYINYDGFNIPDTDNQMQVVHGYCWGISDIGIFSGNKQPPCDDTHKYYIEPASGFWIQNQQTELVDNAIAGCQGIGSAYWWAVPSENILVNNASVTLKWLPFGLIKDDRASACYHAYFSENEETNNVAQAYPTKNGKQDGTNAGNNIIATFDGLTATHNRYRALWLRPTWYVIKNSHFSDNSRSATMLTSGGIDGNAPGVWQLLKNSVLVGEGQNNVGRWGPCPVESIFGVHTGGQWGCIDYSHPLTGDPLTGDAHSAELSGQGYPRPSQNSYGYLLYDGPALIYHDRFVNFNRDDPVPDYKEPTKDCHYDSGQTGCAFSKQLDKADLSFLITYSKSASSPTGEKPFVYEGDAAFGWFPSNQSPYPTATASKELLWFNSNLRHQIFTEHVAISKTFNDSDKNTAIIDEDGTLDGLEVQVASKNGSATVHPISLNNLPFNSVSNSVDECFSRGAQNAQYEGRDSSLMSPAEVGTLEFSSLYPWKHEPGKPKQPFPGWAISHWQKMTFTRTDLVPDGHNTGNKFRPFMDLFSRAGRGLWEPKVSNGYGYFVTVAPAVSINAFPPPDQLSGNAGLYKWLDVGLADIVDPNASKEHPFFIRLGIDYASVDSKGNIKIPSNDFTIERGYKSYYNGDFNSANQQLQQYWRALNCNNIDVNNPSNLPKDIGGQGYCPDPMPAPSPSTAPRTFLQRVDSIDQLTKADGTPNLGVYYYNSDTGYLWLNIAQDEPNAQGPSPLGSCSDVDTGNNPDPDCPWAGGNGESYYACPAKGCIIYTIAMNDPSYVMGPSPTTQLPPAGTSLAPAVTTNPNQLLVKQTGAIVERASHLDKQQTVYYTATNAPNACTITQPPQP